MFLFLLIMGFVAYVIVGLLLLGLFQKACPQYDFGPPTSSHDSLMLVFSVLMWPSAMFAYLILWIQEKPIKTKYKKEHHG